MTARMLLLAALVLFLTVVSACGGGAGGEPTPTPALFRDAQDTKGSAGPTGPGASTGTSVDRLIVRTVNLNMVVKDVAGTLESVASIASGMGGFVLSSRLSGEEESRYGNISIRVPVEETDAALAQLRALAVRVESERSNAQDVTEEYVDLQSNLKNLQATEEQFLTLMKRAVTVEETLKVQKELTSVQGQIEQLKGRMQYLERTSATSLITVEMSPATSAEPLVQPGWLPVETAKGAVRALVSFAQWFANLVIVLGIWAPVWVPLGVGGWFVLRWIKRSAQVDLPERSVGRRVSSQSPTHPPDAASDGQ